MEAGRPALHYILCCIALLSFPSLLTPMDSSGCSCWSNKVTGSGRIVSHSTMLLHVHAAHYHPTGGQLHGCKCTTRIPPAHPATPIVREAVLAVLRPRYPPSRMAYWHRPAGTVALAQWHWHSHRICTFEHLHVSPICSSHWHIRV